MFDAKIVDVGLNTPKCWEMKKFFFGVLEKLCCFDLFPSGRQPRRRIWGVATLQINSQRLTLAASKSELEWLGKKGHRVAYFPAMLCPWLGIRLWPDSSVNYLTGWRFLTFGLWKLENITTSSSAHCLDSSRNTGFRLGSSGTCPLLFLEKLEMLLFLVIFTVWMHLNWIELGGWIGIFISVVICRHSMGDLHSKFEDDQSMH